jgi:hypothetical protein
MYGGGGYRTDKVDGTLSLREKHGKLIEEFMAGSREEQLTLVRAGV